VPYHLQGDFDLETGWLSCLAPILFMLDIVRSNFHLDAGEAVSIRQHLQYHPDIIRVSSSGATAPSLLISFDPQWLLRFWSTFEFDPNVRWTGCPRSLLRARAVLGRMLMTAESVDVLTGALHISLHRLCRIRGFSYPIVQG